MENKGEEKTSKSESWCALEWSRGGLFIVLKRGKKNK